MEREVDLLIAGAGPAGSVSLGFSHDFASSDFPWPHGCAAWAAKYNFKTLVIDKRGDKIKHGHADGLQCRTLEILHGFGIGHRLYREANRLQEVCFWNPDADGRVRRTDRSVDTTPEISRFQQSVIHQSHIEDCFLEYIHLTSQHVIIQRPAEPTQLEIDASQVDVDDSYPVTVYLQTSI
ncbi:uncharacterized protein A1O9_07998 [Exophiala aquamarina CBS 119918]|uniref:FAD-binding domain-containing protein n=1 Tax=Exophiala aquamarina CBS 119918 TaxID=1182545 RepID=A0A072P9I7_9EURO|nr:uncharacterized protein A1O9_07998 [Exophiala aquamarina CBS 119918]KEF56417.1 hypothetical protein A1O9_07998 [Exophiala aquamarina CBS 119918]